MVESLEFIIKQLKKVPKGNIRVIYEPRVKPEDAWKNPPDCWRRLGINIDDADVIVSSLTEKDYVESRQCKNKNGSGVMHIFNREVDGIPLYIKVSYVKKKMESLLVLSFHEKERPKDI